MKPGSLWTPPEAGGAGIALGGTDFTLVIAVHPQCSCTRASLEQIERSLAGVSDRVSTRILLCHPEGSPSDAIRTDLLNAAMRISHVRIQADPGGKQAEQLGCRTSGSVVLYDRDGRPRFWGGVTASRGHSGDCPGSEMLRAIVSGTRSDGHSTPVFGCGLQTPQLSAIPEGAGGSIRR